jgi:predicted RNA-binding protein with TRAM domain
VNLLSSEERRFGGRSFNKPVEEGKEYEVDIKETSRRGDGVARVEGFVIFVPETKPGEHVKVRITQVGPRFATAQVVK